MGGWALREKVGEGGLGEDGMWLNKLISSCARLGAFRVALLGINVIFTTRC